MASCNLFQRLATVAVVIGVCGQVKFVVNFVYLVGFIFLVCLVIYFAMG